MKKALCLYPVSPAKPGREAGRRNEYERRAAANVFCAIEPKAGRHWHLTHACCRALNLEAALTPELGYSAGRTITGDGQPQHLSTKVAAGARHKFGYKRQIFKRSKTPAPDGFPGSNSFSAAKSYTSGSLLIVVQIRGYPRGSPVSFVSWQGKVKGRAFAKRRFHPNAGLRGGQRPYDKLPGPCRSLSSSISAAHV